MKIKNSLIATGTLSIFIIIFFMYQRMYHGIIFVQPQAQDQLLTAVTNQDQINVTDLAADISASTVDKDTQEHLFKLLDKNIYVTPQERQQFFMQQGIEYCNEMQIEYTPLLMVDVYQSEKFLSNQGEHQTLTKVYGKAIADHYLIPMSLRWINEHVGHGIFAEVDIPQHAFIGLYAGVVQDRDFVDNKDYAWAYPVETLQGGKTTIDALQKGNELRFVNDGKDPNCIVKYIIGRDGLWYVCYLASKNIQKGEQLLVSYGPAYWDTRKYSYQELLDAY